VKAYFSNLNERERWILLIGGIFVFFFLFYWILYAPLKDAVDEKTIQLKEKAETLVWMKQVRQQNTSTSKPLVVTNSQLLTLLANQLQTTSFQQHPYKLQQTGAGDIQLTYESVPYNAFVQWLWALNEKYAIELKQFNVERSDLPGIVKIMVLLSAKSA
jgi:general secretion pathway protein M